MKKVSLHEFEDVVHSRLASGKRILYKSCRIHMYYFNLQIFRQPNTICMRNDSGYTTIPYVWKIKSYGITDYLGERYEVETRDLDGLVQKHILFVC